MSACFESFSDSETRRHGTCTHQLYGVGFKQRRNETLITRDVVSAKVVTAKKELTADALRDLVLASITIKCVRVPGGGGLVCLTRHVFHTRARAKVHAIQFGRIRRQRADDWRRRRAAVARGLR